jgi:hypothetical protein
LGELIVFRIWERKQAISAACTSALTIERAKERDFRAFFSTPFSAVFREQFDIFRKLKAR